jgi:hypothetical protein
VVPWLLIGWILYRLTVGRRKKVVERQVTPPSDSFGPTPNPT